MKILYSWLKEFIDTKLSPAQIQEALTMAGVEASSCRFLGEGLENVVTAKILDKSRHPNADRLSFCRVTDGLKEYDIVCGAKNMAAGDVVALAKVGAKLPNGVEIKKTLIRGCASEGMLCSEQELKLSDEAAGIIILAPETSLGLPLADAVGLSDWLLEIEITPNRGDCLSVLGVAMELGAITGEKVRLPEVSVSEDGPPIEDLISITVTDAALCPRYSARAVVGLKVAPSPEWIRRRLSACGIRPINNVVDVTNYILLELGQPMHAFDLEQVNGARIDVRVPGKTMPFATLDGIQRSIDPDMLLIWSAAGPIAVAGVMGGVNSEVTEDTTRVLFESAHFDPASVRRTGRRLGLSSESSYRFERGVDPGGTMFAADRAVSLLAQIAPLSTAKGKIDVVGKNISPRKVSFRPARATKIVGMEYPPQKCKEIFERLSFPVDATQAESWTVTVPTRRFDIEREIDLIEEIARLSGYGEIPTTYPESGAPEFSADDYYVDLTEKACDFLRANGFNQAVNFSFVSGRKWDRLANVLDFNPVDAVRIMNPITDDTTLMRPSLVTGLLQNAADNEHRFIEDIRLYETGKAFGKSFTEGHFEEPRLAMILCGSRSPTAWSGGAVPVDFYDIKGIVEGLLLHLKAGPIHSVPTNKRPFLEEGKCADLIAHGECIGWLGAIHRKLLEEYEITTPVFYGEIRFQAVAAVQPPVGTFRPLAKFPPVFRDLACVFPIDIPVGDVLSLVRESATEIEETSVFDVFTGEKIGEGLKSVGIRLKLQPLDKTLTDADVNSIHTKVVDLLENRFGGRIRTT